MKNGRIGFDFHGHGGFADEAAAQPADTSAASPAVLRPRAGTAPISGIVIDRRRRSHRCW
jgi:hypothetical protein